MATKSKMKCNKVVASDRPGKKKMVKACEGDKKRLYTSEPRVMAITIQTQPENHSRLGTSVIAQTTR